MSWKKATIQLENGTCAEAQVPLIISASRSTDIPAFYAKWFFERLEKGYSAWTNPFNGVRSYVSYDKTRFIVFWSKNPYPLIDHLDKLKSRPIPLNCYIQFTLNDYVKEGLEKGVPPLDFRIKTFKQLVDKLGFGSVVWRFDPLILTNKITEDDLLAKIENIGNQLKGYTEKLVFSFADIASYKKVKSNLEKNGVNYQEWTEEQMINFSRRLSELNKKNGWNYVLATCGEKPIFQQFGIQPNHCVDDRLMVKIAHKDTELMKFLGAEVCHKGIQLSIFDPVEEIPSDAIELNDTTYAVIRKNNKDRGQRTLCGCMVSKDIGEYNTCPHQCEYCYANTSKEKALANYKRHKENPNSEIITGE